MKSYCCNQNYIEFWIRDSYDAWEKSFPAIPFDTVYDDLYRFIATARAARMIGARDFDQCLTVLVDYSRRARIHAQRSGHHSPDPQDFPVPRDP